MNPRADDHAPLVTIASLYGAAGTEIGARVADLLGVLKRAVPAALAARTGLGEAALTSVDERPRRRLDRLAGTLGRVSTITGGVGRSVERLDADERMLRSASAAA